VPKKRTPTAKAKPAKKPKTRVKAKASARTKVAKKPRATAKKPASRAKSPRSAPRTAGRRAPARRVLARETVGLAGPWARFAPRVAAQLITRGLDTPDPDVVGAIAAVSAGYRQGPAADPPFPTAVDADDMVADSFVDLYWTGSRSPGPDRRSRLPIVRQTVNFGLEQMGLSARDAARDTIAWIILGVWRPGLDEIAKLNGLAVSVVPWYRAGLA
jgi:hypothetical protein